MFNTQPIGCNRLSAVHGALPIVQSTVQIFSSNKSGILEQLQVGYKRWLLFTRSFLRPALEVASLILCWLSYVCSVGSLCRCLQPEFFDITNILGHQNSPPTPCLIFAGAFLGWDTGMYAVQLVTFLVTFSCQLLGGS